MPFAVTSIQVDGGSEFRATFETACQQRDIALFVLPPKSPKYNAHVERAHRTLREEFYGQYRHEQTLHAVNLALNNYQQHYCHHRPHGGKKQNFQTPMAYYQQLKRGRLIVSNVLNLYNPVIPESSEIRSDSDYISRLSGISWGMAGGF